MEQLIQARCNVDLEDMDGRTPLHVAAQAGHASVTKKLLAARCNVDLLDCRGLTALQVAEQFSSIIVSASGERQPFNSKVEPDALQVIKLQGNAAIAKLLGSVALLLGRRVVINGLVANPELNGRTGTALSFYGDKGRYAVKLDQPSTPLMSKPCDLFTTVSTAALCYMS
jgi:hypothetical protein